METLKYQLYAKPISFEKVNDQFTVCKCYVLAIGKNRNLTHISRETVDAALPTLPYSPVVAHLMYDESEDAYYVGGHDCEIEDGKLKYVTVPYGVVVNDSFGYEDVEESSGAVSTYLTCSIILWTGRYGDLMKASYDDKTYFGQSMEIIPTRVSKYAQDDRYTDIESFTFSCLTLLGKSDDPEHHVEPCFPSACVQPYSCIDFSDSYFAEKFEELKSAMREALSQDGEANTYSKEECVLTKLEILEKYNLTPETCEIDIELYTEETLEEKLKEMYAEKSPESEEESHDPEVFELNTLEKANEISIELSKEKIQTDWGWEYPRYWLVEIQGNDVIVEDADDHYRKYAIPVVMNGDFVSLDFDSKRRVKTVYEPMEGEAPEGMPSPMVAFSSMVSEKMAALSEEYQAAKDSLSESEQKYTALSDQYSELSTKYDALIAEKKDSERETVFKKFDAELSGSDEYESLKSDKEMSIEQLEERCYALIGKKKFSYVPSSSKSDADVVKFGAQKSAPTVNDALYGGLREKYLNKN